MPWTNCSVAIGEWDLRYVTVQGNRVLLTPLVAHRPDAAALRTARLVHVLCCNGLATGQEDNTKNEECLHLNMYP
jgi:hypothetical protein